MERVRGTKWRNGSNRVALHIECDQTRGSMRKTFVKQDVLMMGSSVLMMGSNVLMMGSSVLMMGSSVLMMGSSVLMMGSNVLML